MQRNLLSLACGLLLFGGSQQAGAQRLLSSATPKYVDGKVRVKLQPEVAERLSKALLPTGMSKAKAAYVKTGITQLDRVSQQVKAVKMTRVFPYAGKDEARHKEAGLDLWYDIAYSTEGMSPAEVRNLYKAVPGVSHAQRIVKYSIDGNPTFRPLSPDDIARAQKAASTMPFNDPLLPDQWHYHNDGSLPGSTEGADINVFPAWAEGNTGKKDVVVAIIDGGFQIDHPDLKDNLWINEAELNGQPGVDDDGDGYVDDVYGYNFVINSANVTAHQHGTHVAGTVGATNNNGLGVAGVAGGYDGTGGVKMMVCQVFDSNASENADANFAGALVYAADRGASIAQCSWGSAEDGEEDVSISDAVRYFTKYGGGDKMSGGLCIFASGNTSNEGEFYPGCLPEAVAVAASTPMGTAATYSSHGTWVDVAAPGGYSEAGEKYEVLSTLPNNSYGYMEGTSMAAPHVSGVAALILSKYGNKNFSNETLRTLLTSSVNRLYYDSQESAEEFGGKCGSGVIDAYKALQGSESSVPSAVADLTVVASHNYATVEWTIPETEERSVDHHVIYFSKEPITADTELSKLGSQTVDTKYNYSGDRMTAEVEGLEAMTKYYFTIVAYNRWGKASPMSAVVEATTNEGPTAKLSTDALTMTVNAAKNDVATVRFRIENTGKGILKYGFSPATKSATMTASSTSAKPSPGRTAISSGKVSALSSDAKEYPVVSADYRATDYPDTLRYATKLKAFIGENDTEMPNALAQYFYVDPKKYPDGFNLTDLYFLGQYGKNPEIEIYDGSRSISAASLITKVKYDEWNYNTCLPLEEQQFFAPGKSFWVVAKFAAGVQRPLGACEATVSGIENYSFYSSDNGETWTQLSQVLKGSSFEDDASKMTWGVYAFSKNPNWSSVLSPDPAEGEVEAGKTQTVKLSNDGQSLVNGKYVFNLHLNTNEATPSDNKIAVTLNVSGNKPSMDSKKLIDYGSLLVGQEKTYSVELLNNGYGVFGTTKGYFYEFDGSMTSTSDQFEIPSSMQSIQARSSRLMDITFKPTKAGNFSSTIQLTDKNGIKHSFTVCGTAIDPAKLSTGATEFDLGDLRVGDGEKEAVISIKNEGKYPLQYVFPKFSDTNIEGSGKAHKYGYTYQTNIDGINKLDYEPAPELDDETDITSLFNDNNWQSGAVPLGFKFPFYGQDFQEVYINSRGAVQMQLCKNVSIGAFVPDPYYVRDLGYISGYANVGDRGNMWMSPDSKVSYGHKDGKFYVIYKNVMVQGQNHGTAYLSMHMVLDAQGNTTIYYDDYNPDDMLDGGLLNYIGVCDIGGNDPMSVTYDEMARAGNEFYKKIKTGSVIRLVAPGKSMITSLSSADGYLGIGESRDITVKAKASDDLFAGELTNHLVMLTNDPEQPSKVFNIKANITGDSFKAEAVVDSAQVDFGRVFRTSQQRRTMRVLNNGTKDVQVTAVTLQNGAFAIDDDIKGGFTVKPNESKDVRITLPTDKSGTVSDVLTVSYADGTKHETPVKAEVIGAPTATVTPDKADVTVAYGDDATLNFNIANTGDEPLEVATAAADWYSLANAIDDEQATVDYKCMSSDDYDWVKFGWEDILNDADEHCNLAYFADQTDYKEVSLPFDFPFYGKKYRKMYIYDTGFIQFTKPKEDYKMFPEPPQSLPNGDTFYRNVLAPLWGNHSMSSDIVDGIYYKMFDDHVVVTFKNYGNSVMDGFNFQAILRKDGTVKFQYMLDATGQLNGIFGIAGAQDDDAKRGFTVSSANVAPGKAVEIRPEYSYAIAPGKSVDMPVALATDKIADTYETALALTTNDPQRKTVSLPVRLTTTGEAVPDIPEQLAIKQVYDKEYQLPAEVEFTVSNRGHKAFTISNISSKLFEEDENYQYEAQLAVWQKGASGDDPDPGPLSLHDSDESGYSYQPYWPGQSDPIVVGEEPVKMKVMYTNVAKPVTRNDVITFDIEGSEPVKTAISVQITDAPAMTFSEDSVIIDNVDNAYTGTRTVTIGNKGKYQLEYSLTMDAAGNDVSIDDELGGGDWGVGGLAAQTADMKALMASDSLKDVFRTYTFEPIAKAKAMAKASRARQDGAYVWDDPIAGDSRTPDAPDHTGALYYPVMQPISAAKISLIGSGESHLGDNFIAATRYTAPEEGFNLSHVFFVGTIGDLENVDVEASVILGDNVASTKKIVGHGKLRIEKEEESNGGHYGTPYTVKLDNPVFINPNDTFYVALKFPAGYPANMFMVSKDGDMEDNRFMGYFPTMGGWIDVEAMVDAAYSYGAFGYFMTALEEQPGKPWISLSPDSKKEGVLQVGESADVTLDINAAAAYFDRDNKATLVVRSNDPNKRVYNYHVYLNRNGAPVITAPKSTTTVAQGGTATVKVKVADADGDAFKVSVADAANVASVGDCTNANGTQEGVSLSDGTVSVEAGQQLNLTVKLAPGYDVTPGLTTFSVYATDANGNERQADVNISIEATNRAPEYIGAEEFALSSGTLSAEYSWADMFSDPEGDQMTYDAYPLDAEAAVVYKSATGFIIAAKKAAQTELVLVATDEGGAKTTVRKPLTITSTTGISGVTADNAGFTADADGITAGKNAAHADFYVYDVAGKLLAHSSAKNLAKGDKVALGTGKLAQGVYTVVAVMDGKTAAVKFAVK